MGQRNHSTGREFQSLAVRDKETVDIDIFETYRNSDKKNHAIYQNKKWISLENKEGEPVEPIQLTINQSNTYRKDLSWLHFDDEPRVQER